MLPPLCPPQKKACYPPRKLGLKDMLSSRMFRLSTIKRHYSSIPLAFLIMYDLCAVTLFSYNALFCSTIDVRLSGRNLPRYEMTSSPGWFDLRKPRCLKLLKIQDIKPAIHLDNRYRLMRGEQMLDALGNPTDEIGEDETRGEPFEVERIDHD
ncbi:uncharacterized protein LOC122502742 [Leptopilina heterotoma]|uniref:uncharacterized protein LOC122502742 n=1 Tax=Leptopilina heterotoma TaxID=63436 RepID=UPI001CA9EE25|nr:uncharacterized protein LOC122502742 [Leptopilina heterotoma]XP_043468868.1 uncharacterized protein LOC122502742 [Leptopilina heterotoma]